MLQDYAIFPRFRILWLVIVGHLAPIIGMLVVEKEGSLFNPRDWIKDKRIGSVRNHL